MRGAYWVCGSSTDDDDGSYFSLPRLGLELLGRTLSLGVHHQPRCNRAIEKGVARINRLLYRISSLVTIRFISETDLLLSASGHPFTNMTFPR